LRHARECANHRLAIVLGKSRGRQVEVERVQLQIAASDRIAQAATPVSRDGVK
jgi:hypothetical protein